MDSLDPAFAPDISHREHGNELKLQIEYPVLIIGADIAEQENFTAFVAAKLT